MKLHSYKNYSDYRNNQIKANKAKLDCVWVRPETIDLICQVIKVRNHEPKFGICHGTRRGIEQGLFKSYLKCEVIGTEISDTAEKFPDTIEWDFHMVKPEWEKACDFIYSNSLDHAYNPQGALEKWISCLNEKGLLIIEWAEKIGKRPKRSTPVDPFTAETVELEKMIEKAGGKILRVHYMQYGKDKKYSSSGAIVALIFVRPA